MNAVVDNDVIFKGSCYGLMEEIVAGVRRDNGIGVLGTARFVISRRLEKTNLNGDRAAALKSFLAFLSTADILEPGDDEQRFAADLELAAQNSAVNLDVGESQLCAILVLRNLSVLLTGDKRAVVALETLLDACPPLTRIRGRVKSLEQAIAEAVARLGCTALRTAVCAEPQIDKALAICFSCRSGSADPANVLEGLISYINDLRKQAGRVLAA
jgi:hypothetical protein